MEEGKRCKHENEQMQGKWRALGQTRCALVVEANGDALALGEMEYGLAVCKRARKKCVQSQND